MHLLTNLRRFWTYQKVRFPLIPTAILVCAFVFSASGFSGQFSFKFGTVAVLTVLVFLFWLRVLDEHKNQEIDSKYRSELPVPSGLVTLAELRWVGVAALLFVAGLNAIVDLSLLVPIAIIFVYSLLMYKEFFVGAWLRAHPTVYLMSHMIIMPLLAFYVIRMNALMFLIWVFLNGLLMEIGRKIRSPEEEKTGIDTYSKSWGPKRATSIWMGILCLSLGTAIFLAGANTLWTTSIFAVALACVTTAARAPKTIDKMSGLWCLCAYLWLGLALLYR